MPVTSTQHQFCVTVTFLSHRQMGQSNSEDPDYTVMEASISPILLSQVTTIKMNIAINSILGLFW